MTDRGAPNADPPTGIRINEDGRRLAGVIQVARDHRQDGVGEPCVLRVALDDDRGSNPSAPIYPETGMGR